MDVMSLLNMEDNEEALDLGFTLVAYGAILGMAFVVILLGASGFVAYMLSGGLMPGYIVLFLVFSLLLGWMGATVAAGGAAYAVIRSADQ